MELPAGAVRDEAFRKTLRNRGDISFEFETIGDDCYGDADEILRPLNRSRKALRDPVGPVAVDSECSAGRVGCAFRGQRIGKIDASEDHRDASDAVHGRAERSGVRCGEAKGRNPEPDPAPGPRQAALWFVDRSRKLKTRGGT